MLAVVVIRTAELPTIMNRSPLILLLATATAFAAESADKPVPPGGKKPPSNPLEDKGRPVAKEPSMTPAETAKAFKLPPGFKVQVVAGEPDIVQPIAYAQDDRGRLWVVTNTNYPKCPGEPKDSILIFEDADGDGRAPDWNALVGRSG